MSNLLSNSSSNSIMLQVSKLYDNRSNWSDYQPRIQKAMGSKGLWRHVEGKTVVPKPYMYNIINGKYVLPNLTTPAMEDQIEHRESRVTEYKKRDYLAQHIILLTTLICLGVKIKDLTSAEEMWKIVISSAMMKSTLYLIDAEDQLLKIKLAETKDPKTHLSELQKHFETMVLC